MRTLTQPLNMSPGGIPPVIHVSQYDSDFTIVFTLFSTVGDFTIESGTTAMVRGTKSSGTGYSADAAINISAKTVTVTGNAQMTAAAGQNIFEIVLKRNNKEISSKNFILHVERAALDADTITDESVLKELDAIIEGAETATQAAEDANDAADRAEAAAQSLVIDPTPTPGSNNAVSSGGVWSAASDLDARVENLEQGGSGLTNDIKSALLQIAQKVAYIDDDGQTYYNDLYNALYPPATLISISAVYTQSGAVYDTDTLDSLKTNLVVTGRYSDSSTRTITGYVLSGTLVAGTSTITVSYGGKTTTFNVTVSERSATLQSITATFTQGSAVIYTDSSLNDLKPYLVVTARYSDSTTQTVTGYTLSGTLTAGTSTITASYGGKTATFTVNVTASPSEKELSYLRSVFDNGTNKIYESTPLESLKQYLTVTAHYTDGTSAIVTNYTLSGSLIGGQITTIAVTYSEGGVTKQTSFAVTVEIIMYNWDFTTSMADTCANKQPDMHYSETAITRDSNGLNFTAPVQVVTLINGDDNINHLDMTIEIDVASFDFKGDSTKHVRFFMDQRGDASNSVGTGPLIFRANYGWTSYGYSDAEHIDAGYRKWSDTGWGSLYDVNQINALNGKTVKIYYGADGHTRKLYLDGTLIGTMTDVYFYKPTLRLRLGGGATFAQSSGDQCYDMTISGVRIYRGEV